MNHSNHIFLCTIEMAGAWRLAIGLLPLVAATLPDENITGTNIYHIINIIILKIRIHLVTCFHHSSFSIYS